SLKNSSVHLALVLAVLDPGNWRRDSWPASARQPVLCGWSHLLQRTGVRGRDVTCAHELPSAFLSAPDDYAILGSFVAPRPDSRGLNRGMNQPMIRQIQATAAEDSDARPAPQELLRISPAAKPEFRVLHIIPRLLRRDYGVLGGAERYALELARHMAD